MQKCLAVICLILFHFPVYSQTNNIFTFDNYPPDRISYYKEAELFKIDFDNNFHIMFNGKIIAIMKTDQEQELYMVSIQHENSDVIDFMLTSVFVHINEMVATNDIIGIISEKRECYAVFLGAQRPYQVRVKNDIFYFLFETFYTGMSVFPIHSGTVKTIGYSPHDLGNYIAIESDNYTIIYGNLMSVAVNQNMAVVKDTKIGYTGMTGMVSKRTLTIGISAVGMNNCMPIYIELY
jgi:hypothetical protein